MLREQQMLLCWHGWASDFEVVLAVMHCMHHVLMQWSIEL